MALAPAAAFGALSDEIQVYTDDINKPGEYGLELHANGTPKGRSSPDYPGEVVPNHGLRLTPEFSRGLTEALETGLYLPVNFDSAGRGELAGAKLRLKWLPLHAAEGASGWYAGANVELSRLQQKYSESRNSAELRLMAGYRGEGWLAGMNPVFGWDLSPGYRKGAPDFALAFKASKEIAPKVAIGAEYFSELGTTARFLSTANQANTLYGVVDFEIGGWGFNVGVGRGLTGAADRYTVKAIFDIPF